MRTLATYGLVLAASLAGMQDAYAAGSCASPGVVETGPNGEGPACSVDSVTATASIHNGRMRVIVRQATQPANPVRFRVDAFAVTRSGNRAFDCGISVGGILASQYDSFISSIILQDGTGTDNAGNEVEFFSVAGDCDLGGELQFIQLFID